MVDRQLLDKIDRIEVVNVQPGDVVIVSFDEFVNMEETDKHYLTKRLKEVFPGARVIIMSHAEISVFRECELPLLKG